MLEVVQLQTKQTILFFNYIVAIVHHISLKLHMIVAVLLFLTNKKNLLINILNSRLVNPRIKTFWVATPFDKVLHTIVTFPLV